MSVLLDTHVWVWWLTPGSPLSRAERNALAAAVRDPDPVLFLEPTRLYRLFKEEVVDNGEALALEQSSLILAQLTMLVKLHCRLRRRLSCLSGSTTMA